MKIIELSERIDLLDAAINYFWNCWGSEDNFAFYKDCIENSVDKNNPLPKFYLATEDDKIVGSYALLVNDIISRQDLYPWFACLFVNDEFRNKGIAGKLLQHGLKESKSKGYDKLYLSSDLENFYESKGWLYIADGYNVVGEAIKIYSKMTR